MKSFLQDLAIVLALGLVLAWTHLNLEWYHWSFIGLAMVLHGLRTASTAWRQGYATAARNHTSLNAEDFDKWLISHGLSPREVAEETKKRNESH